MQNFMQFYTEVNFIDDDALSLCLSLSTMHISTYEHKMPSISLK